MNWDSINKVKVIVVFIVVFICVFLIFQTIGNHQGKRTVKKLQDLTEKQEREINALSYNLKQLNLELNAKRKELSRKGQQLEEAIADKIKSERAYYNAEAKFERQINELYKANDSERAILLDQFKTFKYEN